MELIFWQRDKTDEHILYMLVSYCHNNKLLWILWLRKINIYLSCTLVCGWIQMVVLQFVLSLGLAQGWEWFLFHGVPHCFSTSNYSDLSFSQKKSQEQTNQTSQTCTNLCLHHIHSRATGQIKTCGQGVTFYLKMKGGRKWILAWQDCSPLQCVRRW